MRIEFLNIEIEYENDVNKINREVCTTIEIQTRIQRGTTRKHY